MTKYDEGDKVRLTKAILAYRVRPNTIGVIKKIKGGWKKEYHIRWSGLSHNVIMLGDKDFVELSQGEG